MSIPNVELLKGCYIGDITSLRLYFDEKVSNQTCYQLIENTNDYEYFDFLIELIKEYFPDLNIDLSIKKLYVNSYLQNNQSLLKKIKPRISNKLEIINLMTNDDDFINNFNIYDERVKKFIYKYFKLDLKILINEKNRYLRYDVVEKIGIHIFKYFFKIEYEDPYLFSYWARELYVHAYLDDRHKTCDILGEFVDDLHDIDFTTDKMLCPYYYKFYNNDIDELDCSEKVIKYIFEIALSNNPSIFPKIKMTKEIYDKYKVKYGTHFSFLNNAILFENHDLVNYIIPNVPHEIIKKNPKCWKDKKYSDDLIAIFNIDNENELHYAIDNYWHFVSPEIWFERLCYPSTKHTSVFQKIMHKLNISSNLFEKPINKTQQILLKYKFGQDIVDYMVNIDYKRYLYNMDDLRGNIRVKNHLMTLGYSKKELDILTKTDHDDTNNDDIPFLNTLQLKIQLKRNSSDITKYLKELKKRNIMNIELYFFPSAVDHKTKILLHEKCHKYGFTFGPFEL